MPRCATRGGVRCAFAPQLVKIANAPLDYYSQLQWFYPQFTERTEAALASAKSGKSD